MDDKNNEVAEGWYWKMAYPTMAKGLGYTWMNESTNERMNEIDDAKKLKSLVV